MIFRTLALCFSLITSLAFIGCSSSNKGSSDTGGAGTDTGGTDNTDNTDTTSGGAGGTDGAGGPGGTTAPEWRISAHPCVGNRTDALLFVDEDHGFAGCGSTTVGYGLFETTDGGETWAAISTDPSGFLETFRVMHLTVGPDGLLYVSGDDTASDYLVVSADLSSAPYALGEVMEKGTYYWNSFIVGGYAKLSDGLEVAESYTGSNLVYRHGPDEDWQDATDWYSDTDFSSGLQILDMVVHDDQIYGCGSTISNPPVAYLPQLDTEGIDGVDFEVVRLSGDGLGEYDGEMMHLDVDDSGVVVGGVNQDRNVGMIYVSEANPYDSDDWNEIDVSAIVGSEHSTKINGVCRSGDTLVAVGEYTSGNDGLALVSEDNGATWADITADLGAPPPLHRCQLLETDAPDYIVLSGAEGFFAALR